MQTPARLRILIFLLLSIGFSHFSAAQSFKIDSLKSLSARVSGKEQADILNLLAFELLSYDNTQAKRNAENAFELSEKLNYTKGKAEALIFIGVFRGFYEPIILLKAYQKENLLIIEVTDNGQGIEPELTSRVFDMYFRGSENSKGNGLGLYIVKKAADKLQAIVRLESEVGKRTTVTIAFPNQLQTS